ncbi:SDR family NAD(P)-dependent oxidoreductase [Macrococcus brunensis]|uniref:SDR family NAD(P)-dependent oxidoreductase n=1 Tax=Macrococcus brunensis TaxID=198483 RepID=UPI001EF13BE7|nr:SDR family NAD(P)-dependent oxidoreductase [Macrococcus brunensis]ULG75113.1 SDR family NAD(P)-dependent oxidoreductase [Macrococcus brunensis]
MSGRKKRILVAGGINGMGRLVALNLAEHQIELIILGDDAKIGQALCDEIIADSILTHDDLFYYHADLSSEAKVKELARELKRDFSHIDAMIITEGQIYPKQSLTAEGLDRNLVANYFSHYWLIQQFRPLLKGGRILLPASHPHIVNRSKVTLPTEQQTKRYRGIVAARQALVARILLMRYLNQPLKKQNITINVFNPRMSSRLSLFAANHSGEHIHTASQLALDDDVEGLTGQFFDNNKKIIKLSKNYSLLKADEFYKWSKEQNRRI